MSQSSDRSAVAILKATLHACLQYLTILGVFVITNLVFRLCNRVKPYGLRPDITGGPLVVVSNHQSMIDSFLLGHALLFPQLLWRPRLLPFHLADGKNYHGHRLLGFLYRVLQAIPVDRTKKDMVAFRAGLRALKQARILCVFPEGGRSRPNEGLRRLQPGALAYAVVAKAPIYLCAFQGMHDIQPYIASPLSDAVWWRRTLRHTLWLTSFKFRQGVTFGYGPLLSAEEVQRIAGDAGDTNARVERLTQYVENVLRSLKEDVDRHHNGQTQRLAS